MQSQSVVDTPLLSRLYTDIFWGVNHYSLRNPIRQIPRIKHEFSRHSLRYKLIETLKITHQKL